MIKIHQNLSFQDVDTYKNSTKDDIMNWITTLKKCGVPHDWMVILVEAPDSRKATNKLLPRASVVDKLRTDIGTKNADRCFSLLGTYQSGSGFFFDDEFLFRKVSFEQFYAICRKPIVNFTQFFNIY